MDLFSVAVLVAFVAAGYVAFDSATRRLARRRPAGTEHPPLDVAMLDLAMPAARLSALRASLEHGEPGELFAERLGRLCEALRDAEADWTHVGIRSFPAGEAEGVHDRYTALVREARAREELAADTEAPVGDYRSHEPRASEAALAVVTLVALATLELPETPPASRASARALLDALSRAAPALVTGEIVWLPERTIDGLRAAELAGKAPRLVALPPA